MLARGQNPYVLYPSDPSEHLMFVFEDCLQWVGKHPQKLPALTSYLSLTLPELLIHKRNPLGGQVACSARSRENAKGTSADTVDGDRLVKTTCRQWCILDLKVPRCGQWTRHLFNVRIRS